MTSNGDDIESYAHGCWLQIVQRFSLHHRSLFPIMTSARSNFIFTSHVDQPLAVWDRYVGERLHGIVEEFTHRLFQACLRPLAADLKYANKAATASARWA